MYYIKKKLVKCVGGIHPMLARNGLIFLILPVQVKSLIMSSCCGYILTSSSVDRKPMSYRSHPGETPVRKKSPATHFSILSAFYKKSY
jgi:hypothetical protein